MSNDKSSQQRSIEISLKTKQQIIYNFMTTWFERSRVFCCCFFFFFTCKKNLQRTDKNIEVCLNTHNFLKKITLGHRIVKFIPAKSWMRSLNYYVRIFMTFNPPFELLTWWWKFLNFQSFSLAKICKYREPNKNASYNKSTSKSI